MSPFRCSYESGALDPILDLSGWFASAHIDSRSSSFTFANLPIDTYIDLGLFHPDILSTPTPREAVPPPAAVAATPAMAGGRWGGIDATQAGLDVAGFVPGPVGVAADVVNAGVSLYRGDYAGFGVNLVAAIPFIGDWFKAGRLAAKYGDEAVEAGRIVGVRSAEASSAFGRNPFAGKSAAEVDELLRARGFRAVGPDSAAGRGSYFHPTTGRKYYLDPGGKYRAGTELPHVDVHRMQDGLNLEGVKKKLPL